MVIISLGQGAEFYINENHQMGIRKVVRGDVVADIPLGVAHEKALDNLLTHIGHLRIHTIRS